MRKYILLVLAMLISLSLFSCTTKKNDEEIKFIGIDEFKESMLRKYSIDRIEITEDEENRKMTIDYYFGLSYADTDLIALKFESLLYYKPRENKYDTLTVNIYSQNNELMKVHTYKNQEWTESE